MPKFINRDELMHRLALNQDELPEYLDEQGITGRDKDVYIWGFSDCVGLVSCIPSAEMVKSTGNAVILPARSISLSCCHLAASR